MEDLNQLLDHIVQNQETLANFCVTLELQLDVGVCNAALAQTLESLGNKLVRRRDHVRVVDLVSDDLRDIGGVAANICAIGAMVREISLNDMTEQIMVPELENLIDKFCT
jgi:hypothetical protein